MASSSSQSIDGWTASELKCLPIPLLDALGSLFSVVEATGRWPACMCEAWVSLISKGQGHAPSQLRPISVLSVVYRLWAARRLRDMLRWQEQWSPASQSSFKRGHAGEDVFMKMALQVEEALLTGVPLFGLSLDYCKCFELFPHKILHKLVEQMGLPSNLTRPIQDMYSQLHR
eukprot:5269741-Karenia_brevis.AAC.1